jgi:anthranilate/para-aminobenzoate synthase component II
VLEAVAHSEDGVVQGLRHTALPVHGVQFHPESILTTEGMALLKNFLELDRS